MPLSESRKKANAKYDKEHRSVLSCKVNKDVATRFREICRQEKVSVNAVLLRYVNEIIKLYEDQA